MSVVNVKAMDDFLMGLDEEEVATLIEMVAKQNQLELVVNADDHMVPRWTADEINLIGRFAEFKKEHRDTSTEA